MLNPAYPLALTVGLFSALHCVGMCGGIAGAMSYSLPPAIRSQPARYVIYLLLFNLGRIGSYAVAGALFGSVGAGLMRLDVLGGLEAALRWAAAAVLVGVGLYVGGWLPRLAVIERVGVPIWRSLDPVRRRLLPVTSRGGALLVGAVWGWLPCGLVYSMLIGAPAQGSALSGALYMAAFGLGTLPVVVATGLLAGRLNALGRNRRLQAAAGLILIALALFTLYYQQYNGVAQVPAREP